MSSHSATVRSEVLEALRMSPEPLGRQEILGQCPSAMEAQDISLALNELRKQGLAVRSEDKRWSYADGQGAIAGGPPPGRTAAPTAPKQHSTPPGNEGQAERVRPAHQPGRGGNGAAPAQADHKPKRSPHQVQSQRAKGSTAENEAPQAWRGNPDHDTRDILRDLLKHHVQQSREILETYIEALDNPILNNLLAGLSAAQEALDHHDRSTRQ